MADKNSLRYVPVQAVRANPAALRDVAKESTDFLELVESIKSKGILNPVVVRESKDNGTGETFLALVDGLHRWTGAKEAGLDTIPVHVITADDIEALESQIVTNAHNIQTKFGSYASALKRLLDFKPTLTIPDLAKSLGKSSAWLEKLLKLTELPENIRGLVDEGTITVTNAQALADLPSDEQMDYLDRAMTLPPQQFIAIARERANEVRTANKEGRERKPKEFTPAPFLQGISVINEEVENLNVGKSLINQHNATSALDGWKLALQWVRNMDPGSVQKQRETYEKQKIENEQKRKERREEKERLAREDAAKRLATMSA